MNRPAPSRRTTSGMWCVLGEIATTARLATAGYDWLLLDAQHGAFDRSRVIESLRLRSEDWAPVLVRVPALDFAAIGAALDAGAQGVMVPMVDSAAEARAAAEAALYPPLGRRSWGPIMPLWGRPAPTSSEANERVEVWVMVETRRALDEVEQIAAVPGVTALFVGPNDLALALGTSREELLADTGDDAPLRRVVEACRRAGVRSGAFGGDPATAARLVAIGFNDVAVTTDAGALDAGAAAMLGAEAPARRAY